MHTLLKIGLTLPITSCSAERSFSILRLTDTYLRSTMLQDRLSALAVISSNHDMNVDIEKVMDKFSRKKERRMELLFD